MIPPLQYERIKDHIRRGIAAGTWQAGSQIPSENELARTFSMSRMTANRAIKELEAEGLLERVQGKGTFVTSERSLQSVLRIQGIDAEIRARGNEHTLKLLNREAVRPARSITEAFGLPVGSRIFFSRVLHFENEIPMQLEERWVHPKVAPRYLLQEFAQRTPHDYLMSVAPLTRGVHTIEACLPEGRVARWLKMQDGEPCLLLYRQTWVDETVASLAKLYHPGTRYQLRADWT
jgi:GntR family transcriptional regulator, histidine utilization repressor